MHNAQSLRSTPPAIKFIVSSFLASRQCRSQFINSVRLARGNDWSAYACMNSMKIEEQVQGDSGQSRYERTDHGFHLKNSNTWKLKARVWHLAFGIFDLHDDWHVKS